MLPCDVAEKVLLDSRELSGGRRDIESNFLCGALPPGCTRAGAVHNPLEERVAREAIRAVYASAGYFACGVQTIDIGPAVQIRAHSAHGVVRRRMHGCRCGRDVDSVQQARFVDARKTRLDVLTIEVREIEK